YNGGQYGHRDATFAAYDLNNLPNLTAALTQLSAELSLLEGEASTRVLGVARSTQSFAYSDYADLSDFIDLLEREGIQDLRNVSYSDLRKTLGEVVIAH